MNEELVFISFVANMICAGMFIVGQLIHSETLFLIGTLGMTLWIIVMFLAFFMGTTKKTVVGDNGSGQH